MESALSNNDILIEILLALPAKPLLRFKCVSKRWNDIISDISFRTLHSQTSKPPITAFFLEERSMLKYVSVGGNRSIKQPTILDFLPEKLGIIASSNGLLCCQSNCDEAEAPEMAIHVCNPATKEHVRIRVPKDFDGDYHVGFGYISEPFRYPHPTARSANFKLVKISSKQYAMGIVFKIYSSETGEWRALKDVRRCDYSLFPTRGVVVSGVLYRMTLGDVILAYDIEKEQSQLITLPVPWKWSDFSYFPNLCQVCIGESKGCLHFLMISEAGLRVWALDCESSSIWQLKHSISLDVIEDENPCFLYNEAKRVATQMPTCLMIPSWIDPICFSDGFVMLRLRTSYSYEIMSDHRYRPKCEYKIYTYHLHSGEIEEVCSHHKQSLVDGFRGAVPYNMSLIPMGLV